VTANNENSGQYYKYHVFCCTNVRPVNHPKPSCGRHGADEVFAYLREKVLELGLEGVRINSSGCLGRCEKAPAMVVYPEGVWYNCRSREDIDRIVVDHFQKGKPPKHLMLSLNE